MVDDDVTVAMLVTLQVPGIALVEATRVADGIAAVEAEPLAIDAAVVDRRLPDGDGLHVVRALRRRPGGSAVPVVVISAWPEGGDPATLLGAGADAFLAKPFDPAGLQALLERLGRMSEDERRTRRAVLRARLHSGRPAGMDDGLPPVAVPAVAGPRAGGRGPAS